MNAIVIEHVKVSGLLEAWREKLAANEEARVTVRIEQEAAGSDAVAQERPIKTGGFSEADRALEGARRYADWQFVYVPSVAAGSAKSGGPQDR